VVVLYAALGGEADIEAVATVPGLSHLRFGLTRTAADGSLTVHRFEAPRERHRFGFLQPRASAPVLAADAAVFVVPGLAFDHAGVRLGHGTGSFDRLAASLPAARWVGITAAALVVAALPAEPHDLRVEAVLAG
jgi:5-formyltetrahydrofolate cyclo-ligase